MTLVQGCSEVMKLCECIWFAFFFFFFFFFFKGPCLLHMEVPRLGVESELQLLANTTATAKRDPSLV